MICFPWIQKFTFSRVLYKWSHTVCTFWQRDRGGFFHLGPRISGSTEQTHSCLAAADMQRDCKVNGCCFILEIGSLLYFQVNSYTWLYHFSDVWLPESCFLFSTPRPPLPHTIHWCLCDQSCFRPRRSKRNKTSPVMGELSVEWKIVS